MPTIFDVARAAGVSTAAVSLVVNDPHTNRVSQAKRKEIIRVAEKIGYSPNILAKGLAKRRTRVLGLVVPMRDPIFFNHFIAAVLSGIQSCLMESGYHLLVYSHAAKSGRIPRSQILQSRFVDGLIFMNTRLCTTSDIAATIQELQAAQIAFVMVNSYYGHEPINYVGVDDYEIGHLAGRHLLGKGHRSVAILCGNPHSPEVAPLTDGFRKALREGGVRLQRARVAYGGYCKEAVQNSTRAWLRAPEPPTAIFCADDQMVPDIYETLLLEKKRVPQNVAILGRGNLLFTEYLSPKLTTIRIPTFDMGRRAAELLVDMLNGKSAQPQRILLPCALIERESV